MAPNGNIDRLKWIRRMAEIPKPRSTDYKSFGSVIRYVSHLRGSWHVCIRVCPIHPTVYYPVSARRYRRERGSHFSVWFKNGDSDAIF